MQSVHEGRETWIHELPWCAAFEAAVRAGEGRDGVALHVGIGNLTDGELTVIADGDTVADVTGRGTA